MISVGNSPFLSLFTHFHELTAKEFEFATSSPDTSTGSPVLDARTRFAIWLGVGVGYSSFSVAKPRTWFSEPGFYSETAVVFCQGHF